MKKAFVISIFILILVCIQSCSTFDCSSQNYKLVPIKSFSEAFGNDDYTKYETVSKSFLTPQIYERCVRDFMREMPSGMFNYDEARWDPQKSIYYFIFTFCLDNKVCYAYDANKNKLIFKVFISTLVMDYSEEELTIEDLESVSENDDKEIMTNEQRLDNVHFLANKSLIITNILLNIKDQIILELNETNKTFVTLVWINSFSMNNNSTFVIYSLPNHGMVYQKISFIEKCNKTHPNHIELAGTYCGDSQGMTNREAEDYWYLDFDYNNKIINTMTNSYKCWIGVNYVPPMCSYPKNKNFTIRIYH